MYACTVHIAGSGKTTLLRLIAGLEMPTGGKILFDDFDATNTPVQDRQIGFVFQNYALFNHKTVSENIRFGLEVVAYEQRLRNLLPGCDAFVCLTQGVVKHPNFTKEQTLGCGTLASKPGRALVQSGVSILHFPAESEACNTGQ